MKPEPMLLCLALLWPALLAAESVEADRPNSVEFPAQEAKFVRFVILASSSAQPCLDELEVYGPGSAENLALAAKGAKASASSCLAGHAIHQIPHLNDGRYGNAHSWIAAGKENEWAQIELPKPARVRRVVFSRDRDGKYRDRVPVAFEVQISTDGQQWRVVQKVGQALVVVQETKAILPFKPNVLDFPPQKAKFVRMAIQKTNTGSPPCVDELELFGADLKTNLAAGAKPSASSCIEGHAIHKVAHLNDGQYTNTHSWIAAEVASWAQIELPEPADVQRVVFSRDRGGTYTDRVPTEFEIQVSLGGQKWTTVKKVVALENLAIGSPLPDESPREWAHRIAMALSPSLRKAGGELAAKAETKDDVQALLDLHQLDRHRAVAAKRLALEFNADALRRAVADLTTSFPGQYSPPQDFAQRLAAYEQKAADALRTLMGSDAAQMKLAMAACDEILAFQRDALLANPLLDFDEILLLKRKTPASDQSHTYWQWGQKYGMTVNWSCDFRPKNPPIAAWWDDEIVAFSLKAKERPFRTVLKPKAGRMIQHPELHFDARRLLFSMPGPEGAFQVFEVDVDGSGLRQITKDTGADVDNGDPCYLPDGRILFNSTRGFQAVPCENGHSYVANLCITDADGRNTRMLTFDQESNWYPTLLNNGRVLYTRYEYANISHQFARLLFHMNPDGTGQMEYYGSNSYWPNSIFYARPIPNHPTRVIGVVCGHHGPNRTGPLVLFDPAKGRHETSGAVQMILRHGKPVERVVADVLYGDVWPKFVHPWPLSDKYFLASARLSSEQVEYALYLVDIFDNVTELRRLPDHSLLEPIPVKKREPPPVIPDRVRPEETEATVFMADVYQGPGLAGVPRGSVQTLRLFTYNYVYRDTGRRGFGHLATPGVDGPWEPRFILGTVPVKKDGSALFRVPANTPLSVQPLDAEGRALQQMRSWFTAMPGETLSCVGCHDAQNTTPFSAASRAAASRPDPIEPWRGPQRGFDFELEVQPMLDKFCVGCHNGSQPARPDLSRKSEELKLAINREYHRATESTISTILTPSYIALHPYVRRALSESNYALQVPAEFFADTSPLVQMLQKGHHGVTLDAEAWDRLYTWIDLGAPDHGSWKNSEWGVPSNYYDRRLAMLKQFANRADDVEWLPAAGAIPSFLPPDPLPKSEIQNPKCAGWPFDAAEAKRRQDALGLPKTITLSLADGLQMEFALIPPGEFIMGDAEGAPDEQPLARVRIDKPFYMSRYEVTNAQFAALVNPAHHSGHVSWQSIDWRGEGHSLYAPQQPVVRVSWHDALAFCRALSQKTGRKVNLPTEAQWEWACRAGSDKPLWYGGLDDDFSRLENLAGREQRQFAFQGKPKWYLRDDRFDDGALVTSPVGSYQSNPWGLHDMAGNVCEWTRTAYKPYPYSDAANPNLPQVRNLREVDADGRNDLARDGEKVVRGGSWFDKPNRSRSAFRWKYPAWRKVHNVGTRVILEIR